MRVGGSRLRVLRPRCVPANVFTCNRCWFRVPCPAHVCPPGGNVRKCACSPVTEWLTMFLSVHVHHPCSCRILRKFAHTSFILHDSSKAHLFPESAHLICSSHPLCCPPQILSFFLFFHLLSPLQVSFLSRFSIRIETRFENNNGNNNNVSVMDKMQLSLQSNKNVHR